MAERKLKREKIPARTGNVPKIVRVTLDCAAILGFPQDRIAEIELAVEEALVNICKYAYPAGEGDVEVEWFFHRRKGLFSVEVSDSGQPFDPTVAALPDTSEPDLMNRKVGGLGIPLLKEMTDCLEYQRINKKNRLRLVFKLENHPLSQSLRRLGEATVLGSLAVKSALMVMVGTVVIFSLVLTYSYMESRTIILESSEESAKHRIRSTALEMELQLGAVAKMTQEFAHIVERVNPDAKILPVLIRHLVADQKDIYGSTVAFEPYAFDKDLKAYAPYFHITPSGIRFVQLGSPSYNYFEAPWYAKIKKRPTPGWSQPYFDEGGGDVIMSTFSHPFFYLKQDGTRGAFRGVVTADISVDWLTKPLSEIQVGEGGYCFLVSDKGVFLAHPQKEWIMNESLFSIARRSGNADFGKVAKRMLDKRSGFIEMKDIVTGEDSYLAFSRIPANGWRLAMVFLKRDIYSQITRLFSINRILAMAGVMLLAFVAVLIARSITRPLQQLAGAARQVSDGNLDVRLAEVRRGDEVGQLAWAFSKMTVDLKKYIQDLTLTTAAKERIESELAVAARIQQSMLPGAFPAFPERRDIDIHAVMQPAREVGGDFYQFFLLNDHTLFVAIGDVSDKGVPASLFMSVTMFLMHSLAGEGLRPDQILTHLNTELLYGNESCMFVTIFCGTLDLGDGTLQYSNGGHNAPLLIGQDGGVEYLGQRHGPFVGAADEVTYGKSQTRLNPGDTLLLYTDGVTEAENHLGDFYSDERLRHLVETLQGQSSQDVVNAVLADIDEFSQNVPPSDDRTVLAVRLTG